MRRTWSHLLVLQCQCEVSVLTVLLSFIALSYLNDSGHFCGMAEMLTPVGYSDITLYCSH